MSDQAIFIFGCFVTLLVVIASYLVIGVPRYSPESSRANAELSPVRRKD